MSYLQKIKGAKNRKDLARLLGYKPNALTSIIYRTPLSEKYKVFEIPKKNGGKRKIKAPNPKLKKLQKHLANLLYGCLAEIEEQRKLSPVSFGFRAGRSISENAKKHKRRRFVLNLDLQDFFPSFNFGRVRGFFLKDHYFELNEEVATTIAQIACDGVALPQGSPCSPVISELVGQILDLRLLRFAKKHCVRYSRYADDITFSTNEKIFPSALATQDKPDISIWTLGIELKRKIKACGFAVNPQKTRMCLRGSRQTVTGLVVNEKANIKSEYYRKVRAMCDALFQSGEYFHTSTSDQENDLIANINPLEGMLSHIYFTTQSEEKRPIPEQRSSPRAIRKLYRRFLFYKYCIALKQPLIITEGKTDPIYLREAIRYQTSYHPKLGSYLGSEFEFESKFFNYEGQAHEIMDLGGGSGDIKSIPLEYLRNLKKHSRPFVHKPMDYPVILVLDNDDGLKPVASTIKKTFNVSISKTTTDSFYRITENLYLVKTPESNGDSCIEDLFPVSWKSKVLNGKKLSLKSKIDPQTEYGKEVFAKSVIKPNAKRIDFSGFNPLLDRIIAVLNDYDSLK